MCFNKVEIAEVTTTVMNEHQIELQIRKKSVCCHNYKTIIQSFAHEFSFSSYFSFILCCCGDFLYKQINTNAT